MPEHHLHLELLIDYAAGSAPEPVSLLVATHLTFCPSCRQHVARLEDVGGALLDGIEPVPVDSEALDRMLARLDKAEPSMPSVADEAAAATAILPRPLRDYVGTDADGLAWKRYGRQIAEVRIMPDLPNYATRLLRIKAGKAFPAHGHRGREMIVVLAGGFSDERGEYRQGDSFVAEGGDIHHPIALRDGDCICLIVSEAPIHFIGPFGRMLNWIFPTR